VTLWVNHVAIAMPREGDTVHDVNPASSGTAVTGSYFTPTAGRFLVLIVEGAVTSTTPGGWTVEASAVNNTGLYAWSRTAAGSDTISTTHNASNYPAMFHWYEYASGSTWFGDVSSTTVTVSSVNPSLGSITGNPTVFGVKVHAKPNANATSCSWDGSNIEIVDTNVVFSSTDGYEFFQCYQDSYGSASYAPTGTGSGTFGGGNWEALTWAVNATSGAAAASTPPRRRPALTFR
jgi:hypothetical protein